MNKDRVQGAARATRGAIKEATGKLTGNNELEVKGATQKGLGKAQNAAGKVEDKINHETKKL
jgi:uncharacterized protein YjbJ (UPF0337 family)